MNIQDYASHHIAISVRDLDASKQFYGFLGFRPVLYWDSDDGSLTIAHLRHSTGLILELFAYTSSAESEPIDADEGNDLAHIGVKHIALQTKDLELARATLAANGCASMTKVKHGRTDIDFFFVQDPDGMWVEIVQDDRALDEKHPIHLGKSALRRVTGTAE